MQTDENEYIRERKKKVEELKTLGANPFVSGVSPKNTTSEIHQKYGSKTREELEKGTPTFSIAGRIMAIRSFGKASFFQIQDRTGKLQVFVQKNDITEDEFKLFKLMDVGDYALFEGPLFRTKTNELTLEAKKLKMVTKSIRLLPEKWHGLKDIEQRYRQRYVDLIANPSVKETFVKRSKIINAVREFFNSREFLEVETPMMHPIPGGAMAKPFVTHHNTLHMDLFLRVAPELYLKRLVVGGLERVFEINRNFRNEGISIQHNPEFTMLEFYQSYATYKDLMKLTEELMVFVAEKVLGDLKTTYQRTEINLRPPYPVYTMKEALVKIGGLPEKILNSRDEAKKYAESKGIQLKKTSEGIGAILAEIFEVLVEDKLIQPTFITEYPTEVSPLSRKNEANPDVVDRFELFIYGREIANAFSELNDPEDQDARFRAQVQAKSKGDDEAMHYDADYIRALEYGMPPAAGEGIGIDRLVMILTDSPSIRDVILFPQLKKEVG